MKVKDFKLDFNHEVIFDKTILELTGLNDIALEYDTQQNATAPGYVIIGKNYTEREINMIVQITHSTADSLQRYFASKEEHMLYVGNRKIRCNCTNTELDYRSNLNLAPLLKLSFIAPDIFFEDVSDFGENLAAIVPRFGFPWRYTKQSGITFGFRKYSKRTMIMNNGDRPVGIKCIFVSARGSSSGISIKNIRTGEYVKVNVELNQKDKLEISTIAKKKHITLNGVDIFPKIDKLSDFFNLEVGENYLEYDAEVGDTNLDVFLYYVQLYSNGMVIDG